MYHGSVQNHCAKEKNSNYQSIIIEKILNNIKYITHVKQIMLYYKNKDNHK